MNEISLKIEFENARSSDNNVSKHLLSKEEIDKKINAGFFKINMYKNYKQIIDLIPMESAIFGCSGSVTVFVFSEDKFWVLGPVGLPGYKEYFIEQFNDVHTKRIKKRGVIVRGELLFGVEKIADCMNILMEEEVISITKQIVSNYFSKKEKANEIQRLKKLKKFNKLQNNYLRDFDKDGNGEVDIIEGNNEFDLLLDKNQKRIIEKDRNFVQHFVKISTFLKSKKSNIQKIFKTIKNTNEENQLKEYVGILKNEIHTYELILFHSLNMIVSLVEDDMITFYEIYDSFDRLDMFNSKWENDVSKKLSNIGDGLTKLMYSIEEMGQNISREIEGLSYNLEKSSLSLSSHLKELNSSIKVNNMITSIQTYQMYKINKNTKT